MYKRSRLYGKGEVEEKEYLQKSTKAHRQSLGQFMTPPRDVDNAFRDIKININDKVLEPSYGTGNFLDGIIKRGYKNITGVEFDTELFNKFKDKYEKLGVKCINGDYLMSDFKNKFDLIVGNPPYFIYGKGDHPKMPDDVRKKFKNVIKGVTDIYGLFCVKAVEDLKDGGRCCFYIPSTILNASNFELVREYLHKNITIERCEDVKNKDFKETDVENLMMFQFIKTNTPNNDYTYKIGNKLYFSYVKKLEGVLVSQDDDIKRVKDLVSFKSGIDYESIKNLKDIFSDKKTAETIPLIFGENLLKNNTLKLDDLKEGRKQYIIKSKFKVKPIQAPVLIVRRLIGASKITPFVLIESGEVFVTSSCLYATGSLKDLKKIQKDLNDPKYKSEYLDTIKGRSITIDFISNLPLNKEDFDIIEDINITIEKAKKTKEKLVSSFEKFKKEFRPDLDLIYKEI